MEFQIKTKYNFQDLLALNKVVGKRFHKAVNLICRAIIILAGGLLTLSALMVLIIEGFDGIWLLNLLLGLLFLLLGIFHYQINAYRTSKLLVKQAGEITFSFDAEGFSESSDIGSTRRPYGSVFALCHSQNRYFICLDKRHAYILPEQNFIVGSPEAFGPFLEEKCGKPLARLR